MLSGVSSILELFAQDDPSGHPTMAGNGVIASATCDLSASSDSSDASSSSTRALGDSVTLSPTAQAALDALPPELQQDSLVIDTPTSSDSAKLMAYADSAMYLGRLTTNTAYDPSIAALVGNAYLSTADSAFAKEAARVGGLTGEYALHISETEGYSASTSSFASEVSALGNGMSSLDKGILSVLSVVQAAESVIASGSGTVSEVKTASDADAVGSLPTLESFQLSAGSASFGSISLTLGQAASVSSSSETANSLIGLALMRQSSEEKSKPMLSKAQVHHT